MVTSLGNYPGIAGAPVFVAKCKKGTNLRFSPHDQPLNSVESMRDGHDFL